MKNVLVTFLNTLFHTWDPVRKSLVLYLVDRSRFPGNLGYNEHPEMQKNSLRCLISHVKLFMSSFTLKAKLFQKVNRGEAVNLFTFFPSSN